MLEDMLKGLWQKARNLLQRFRVWAEENPKSLAVAVAIALPTGLALIGGYIITTALVYALLTVAAFSILVWKMRTAENRLVRRSYELMRRHPLLTDIAFTAMAFMLSPSGITGMLGASIAAIMVSAILVVMPAAQITEEHSEETVEKVAQPA